MSMTVIYLAVVVYLVAVINVAVIYSLWPSWIGRHSLLCGRHGHVVWPPSWFVAVIDLAVMACGRHGIGP